MTRSPRVVAILPAYNAESSVRTFVLSIPKQLISDIIVVDDCSSDATYAIARKIPGIRVYKTDHNVGYGGNVTFGIRTALAMGADIIIELHPDGEYRCDGIEGALAAVKQGAGLVLGNRFAFDPIAHGMSRIKYAVTRVVSFIDNLVLGTRIPDLHQGFRVYTRGLFEAVDIARFHNGFIFSFEIIAAAVLAHIPIAVVPVHVAYTGKKRGALWHFSISYTWETFGVLWQVLLARAGISTILYTPADSKHS